MGTPEFAVASLDKLVQSGYTISAVITAPDKPAGRGKLIQESAVKKYAIQHQLKVLQPLKLKDEDFINELKSLNANLFVVVAFRMLPEIVWSMPEYGTFNLHASLLPQYRGAAPINWAIINGETETGVTTFFLQHEIDTGDIIFQERISIEPEDNAGTIHDKLMYLGAELVLKTVQAIEVNTVETKSQLINPKSQNSYKHAPKIFKETCLINWSKPAVEIHNLIRGLSPYPTAFTILDGKVLKFYKSRVSNDNKKLETNFNEISHFVRNDVSLKTDNKTFLSIKCTDAYLDILELQMEGKKRMSVEEFLRGYKFS